MIAARLLAVAGSGGSVIVPEAPTVRNLGATGFWNRVSSPASATYNGKTYLTWCDDAQSMWAAEYVHSTGLLSTPVELASSVTAVDGAIHLSLSVLVRSSDHRIVIAGVANGGTHAPAIWISDNPEDATSFPASFEAGPLGTYTYTTLVEISGAIYLWVHKWAGSERDLVCFKSTDNGATWGSALTVMRPAVNSTFFTRITATGSRIDIYATDTDRSASPSSVYHFRFEGDAIFDSDGTSLGALACFSNDGTLVQDDSGGSARVDGAGYTAGGEPICAICIDGTTTQPVKRGLWTGSAWQVDDVADSNGIVDSNVNISSAAIADESTLYVPVKTSGIFELFKYVTANGGTTWGSTQLTSGSAADNAMPEVPQDASGLKVVWGRGTYTDDATFDFTIYGYAA